MTSAPLHPLEDERLKALESLGLLDSLPEESYDRIVELIAIICEVPIAVISLIDKERQWFKAAYGLGIKETPREIAFCAHTILKPDVLSVPDATQDPRFADNPLVTGDAGIRSYFGVPLLSVEGLPLGTLCAIDLKTRNLTEKQIKALQNLSGQVTELLRLRKEEQLVREKMQDLLIYRTAFFHMNDGVVLQDASGAIIHHNPSALRILGLTEDQLLGKTSFDPSWRTVREDGEALPGSEHPASVVLRTGKPVRDFIMGVNTPSEVLRWIQVSSEPLEVPQSPGVHWAVTIFSDVTEKKKAAAHLFQAARMSSLGEMAGGVAHELNTPLAVILACSSVIRRHLDKNPSEPAPIMQKILKIEETAFRISDIVRSLHSFAGGLSQGELKRESLQKIVDETLIFCRERFKAHGIEIYVSLAQDSKVPELPEQLKQVLLNLLSNAFDAVVGLQEKWVSIQSEVVDEHVQIAVVDSGLGLPQSILSRMKDPFFSTKPLGAASGLGLSIAHGVMVSIGGGLEYELRGGHTAMVLSIPFVREGGSHGRVA